MKLRPLSTVSLRAELMLEQRRNANSRKNLAVLDNKFRRWSELPYDMSAASMSSRIHPYPGLGHQLSGWISGYLWASDLGVRYTGGNVTRDADGLFGLSNRAQSPSRSARRVRLAAVSDERDPRSLRVLRGQMARALAAAKGRPVHFELALDQPRWDQTPAGEVVREAVIGGSKGSLLEEIQSERSPFIALHVRRGDVSPDMKGGGTEHSRWSSEDWYLALLRLLRQSPDLSGLDVRLYALGDSSDFPLLQAEGVTLCLNRDRDLDFIELCAARVLVVAPSSFSFTAGLASSGTVIARYPWWHHIPDDGRWVRASPEGTFALSKLRRALNNSS